MIFKLLFSFNRELSAVCPPPIDFPARWPLRHSQKYRAPERLENDRSSENGSTFDRQHCVALTRRCGTVRYSCVAVSPSTSSHHVITTSSYWLEQLRSSLLAGWMVIKQYCCLAPRKLLFLPTSCSLSHGETEDQREGMTHPDP